MIAGDKLKKKLILHFMPIIYLNLDQTISSKLHNSCISLNLKYFFDFLNIVK